MLRVEKALVYLGRFQGVLRRVRVLNEQTTTDTCHGVVVHAFSLEVSSIWGLKTSPEN